MSVVAAQMSMGLNDYLTFEAFDSAISRATANATDALDHGTDGALLVFPEHLGFLLPTVPFHPRAAQTSASFVDFIATLTGANGYAAGVAVFAEHAEEVAAGYDEIFSRVARTTGAYVVAGSLTLPPFDWSPHAGGYVVTDDTKLYNTSPLFSPTGRCLGRTAKLRIPPGEDFLTSPGPLHGLRPAITDIGVIGVVLCFDGYHDEPIAHLDAQGATLVAQPIHFPNPGYRYDGTGSKVPAHDDFGHLLQGRENIRIGVSAALVGETFRDRRAEGVSHIMANRGNPDADWSDIVLADAPDPFAAATVSAIVEP